MTVAPGVAKYPTAFSPTVIGGVGLRNRIFVSAHTTNFGDDFLPTPRHIAYHRERARGGAALIITEPLRVHPTSLGRAGGIGADRAGLAVLTALTTAIRDEGAAVFSQLTHAGRHSDNSVRRTASWGPSPLPFTVTGPVPHAMGRGDLVEIRRCYADTARLARDAGYQGVEIHFGHGHLLHQFISPVSNTRTDTYGGDDEARLRFPMEVLQEVIDAVGSDLVVGVRLSAEELVAGGQDLALGCRMAAQLDALDGVGFLDVSIASYAVPSIGHHVADMSEGRTPYLEQTLAVARECRRTPVLMACRVLDLADAERVLTAGPIAAVAMTRAHIADPHLVRNAHDDEERQTRPCVACNYCIEQIGRDRALSCMMNPSVGREADPPRPADHPRSVLVIGAGPAGLECSRVAAERGHRVEVWEKEPAVGGQVRIGRAGHGRAELDLLLRYEQRQLEDLRVPIRLGRDATVDDVLAAAPEVVVIATGARRPSRLLPGWGATVPVAQALTRKSWTGRTVVVLESTGSWAALSVAESIVARGGQVVLVTAATTPLWAIPEYSRMVAIERLLAAGVQLHVGSRAEFTDGAVLLRSLLHSGAVTVDAVTDVVSVGHPDAVDDLVEPLRDSGTQLVVIGDATAPRSLFEAVFEGYSTGLNL